MALQMYELRYFRTTLINVSGGPAIGRYRWLVTLANGKEVDMGWRSLSFGMVSNSVPDSVLRPTVSRHFAPPQFDPVTGEEILVPDLLRINTQPVPVPPGASILVELQLALAFPVGVTAHPAPEGAAFGTVLPVQMIDPGVRRYAAPPLPTLDGAGVPLVA